MKFRDFDIYHAYYCGLCKDLKERYGRSGQITLSYDMTFLIILLSGLYEPPAEDSIRNCVAHPFQKHAARTNEITQYAADMNIVLSYYKCLDDWTDEHKKKAWINSRLLRSKVKQIEKTYPEKVKLICDMLAQISSCEKANEQDLDKMAGLFGEIMAEIFVWKQDIWKDSLHRMGFFLGKFIYLMDAYEDIDDDITNACYNPFMQFREREDFDDYCKQILTMMIAECSREFEKLPILTHAEILRNILYSGVWCRFEAICEKRQSVNNQENKS
jgi:hypothetical protein